MALTTAQEGKYTFSFGGVNEALWFDVSYNTVTNRWTVVMKKGSMDLNALWWSNANSTQDGSISLSKSDNSLNMNGTGVVWDGYGKISDTGLTGKDHNGSSLLTAGNTYTYAYTTSQGINFESLLAAGTVTLGVRATSVNGSGGIKEVNSGWDAFIPNTPVNVAPVGVNDAGYATEAGGINNGTLGSNATGNVLTNDTDVDGPIKTVSAVRTGGIENSGTAGIVGSALSGTYGSLTLNADGTYTYVIDNSKAAVQTLKAGGTLAESFNYTVSDGSLSDTAVLAITITGANDNATISVNGTPDTAVSEAGGLANGSPGDSSASGDLDLSDVDGGEALFQTPLSLAGTYGDFTFNASSGGWGYTLNDADSDTQALTAGQTTTDSLLVTSFDGTASQVITVNITGANDNATITVNGTPDTAVSEAGGLANGSPGDPSASGDLDVSDVDSGEALFQTPGSLAGTYGDFTFNATTGGWSYTLNDTDSDTQALTAGQSTTDSLLVTSFDGTASQTITVNITGANDNATITVNGTPDLTVIEAGGTGNSIQGDPSASGVLDVLDVDGGEAKFQSPTATSLAGTYGDFTFDASTGVWGYTLNNADPDTQALRAGQAASESLVVSSFDGTASATIQVTITGATDNPTAISDQWTLSNTLIPTGIITPSWFLSNDIDPDNVGGLYVTNVTSLPAGLNANYDAAGKLEGLSGTITAAPGTYSLSYTLNNANGNSSTGNVSLVIKDSTAGADAITVDQAGNDYSFIDGLNEADALTGANSVSGGAGVDYLVGSQGNDTLDGGGGSADVVLYEALWPGLYLPDAFSFSGDGNSWTIRNNLPLNRPDYTGIDTLTNVEFVKITMHDGVAVAQLGSGGNDTLIGSYATNELLLGGNGDDALQAVGGPYTTGELNDGRDILFGGLGNDSLTTSVEGLTIAVGDDQTMDGSSQGGNDTLQVSPNSTASAGNYLYGDAISMLDHARGGNDLFIGRNGINTIAYGDAGSMSGSALGGNDTVQGADNSYTTVSGDAEYMYGNSDGGNDYLIGGSDTAGFTAGLPEYANYYSNELAGDSRGDAGLVMVGESMVFGNDTILGGVDTDADGQQLNNYIYGDALNADGREFLPVIGYDAENGYYPFGIETGGMASLSFGSDAIFGGDGAYNFLVGDGAYVQAVTMITDTIVGGSGTSTINELYGDSYSGSGLIYNNALVPYPAGYLENDPFSFMTGVDGNWLRDANGDPAYYQVVSATKGNLFAGNDALTGGAYASNTLYGDMYCLRDGGRMGDDTLIGGAHGTNTMYGDAYTTIDEMIGLPYTLVQPALVMWGNDRLVSGTNANDEMWGDAYSGRTGAGGLDTFVFAANNGQDTIHDFEVGRDKIDLTALGTVFGALSISSDGTDSTIGLGGSNTVKVIGVATLGAADFIFT